MFNHAPQGYVCPFCLVAQGVANDRVLTVQSDIVAESELAIAFIAAHWRPKNAGHVLIVPRRHYENLYEVPDDVGAAVFSLTRRVAIAMKHAYRCDGISTRQHNEPAGYQDVWHFHVHLFPRYANDRLYLDDSRSHLTSADERMPYAQKLRAALREAR